MGWNPSCVCAVTGTVLLLAIGCAPQVGGNAPTASLPEVQTKTQADAINRFSCGRSGKQLSDWTVLQLGALDPWLDANGVIQASQGIIQENLIQFAIEFAKVPHELRSQMVGNGSKVRLIRGQGVSEDPTWPVATQETFDGRSWSTVPGSGGGPTRVVVNRLYEGHGSINLVLHEYGHSLDSLFKQKGISTSRVWTDLWAANPEFAAFIERSCGRYCADHPSEAFAESAAYYFSCDGNRRKIEEKFPLVARFLGSLSTLDLRHLN